MCCAELREQKPADATDLRAAWGGGGKGRATISIDLRCMAPSCE